MEFGYLANYFIFSIFFFLFTMEVGVALSALIDYSSNRKAIRRYLLPIWGLDGTFGVFYLVNLFTTYPAIIGLASNYILLVLIAGMLFLFRSAFIAFSERAQSREEEDRYVKIYALSTALMALVIVSILCSVLSGMGISQSPWSINPLQVILDPFALLMFVSAGLIALFITSQHFASPISKNPLSYALLPLALIIASLALQYYQPYIFANSNQLYEVYSICITLLVLTLVMKRMAGAISAQIAGIWLVVSINLLGILEYPNILGGGISLVSYMNNAAITSIANMITIGGGSLLAVAMGLFYYLNFVKK